MISITCAFFRKPAIWTTTLLLLASPTIAYCLEPKAVNDANWSERSSISSSSIDPLVVKAQILLDRAQFSPGEVDGKWGENVRKALKAYAIASGLAGDDLSKELWEKLSTSGAEPALFEYSL